MKDIKAQDRAGSVHFAAVNSGEGFKSFYERVFGGKDITHRYIIKGGPGTGKSSFMRRVASSAEAHGYAVEYYRCSSDPDSLDGIVFDTRSGRVAMLDGTAPHSMDAVLPGVRDEIVNLGEFWDPEILAKHYNEIVSLDALKDSAYRKAYRYLSAAAEVEKINISLAEPFLLRDKLESAVGRLLKNVPNGKGFSLTPAIADSVSMKGSVRFDSYERAAKKLYIVDDHYSMGAYFLSYVIEEAQKKNCAVRVSYRPLLPELPDAVMLTESGVCFVMGVHSDIDFDGRVNMKRFIDGEGLCAVKTEYRINKRLCEALTDSAIEALADAGRYHFKLEEIYVSSMDFSAEEKFAKSFCAKLF